MLSLSPGQQSLDRGKFPNDMSRVISDCCGLVFVDEEESTVHYIHQSVKQYLFTNNSPHLDDFDIELVDQHIGFLCMTYLDFPDFKHQLAKVDKKSNTLLNPVQLGLSSISGPRSVTTQMALKLLSRRGQLQDLSAREFGKKVEDLLNSFESSHQNFEDDGFHFFEYAKINWIYHTKEAKPEVDPKMWTLFRRCLEGADIVAQKPWEPVRRVVQGQIYGSTSPQSMIIHGHFALLLYFTQHRPRYLTDEELCGILEGCTMEDRFRFTQLIVTRVESSQVTSCGLFYAALAGCISSADASIQAGADVDFVMNKRLPLGVGVYEMSPLEAAAAGGHLEIVERLLSQNAIIARPEPFHGMTCLDLAAAGGHLKTLERLLAVSVNLNSFEVKRNGSMTLRAAARAGYLEVVEKLLEAGATVHLENADGVRGTSLLVARGTRLLVARKDAYLEIVELLLAAGATIHAIASGYLGRSALQAAVNCGDLNTVEKLLEAGVDANASASEYAGRIALSAAMEDGYLGIVERLLAAGVTVNAIASGCVGRAALREAAEGSFLEIVDMLLEAGVDVNSTASGYMEETAISAAIKNGHSAVAERLKQAGAIVD